MSIRRIGPADAAEYQALRLRALREDPECFGSSFEEECDRPIEAIAKTLAQDSGRDLFCAFDDGLIVGMIGLGRERGRKECHKAFIRSMYVAPSHRGKHLGRQLLDHALAVAASMDGVRQVTLSVTGGNVAAIALYEAAGFVTTGLAPEALFVDGAYYDEVSMMRRIGAT